MTEERELFYRLHNRESEDGPTGEFLFFVGGALDLREAISEFRGRHLDASESAARPGPTEPQFAYDLLPYSELVAKTDSPGRPLSQEVPPEQPDFFVLKSYVRKRDEFVDWARQFKGAVFDYVKTVNAVDRRRKILLALAAAILMGSAIAIATFIVGKSSHPGLVQSANNDAGKARPGSEPGLLMADTPSSADGAGVHPDGKLSEQENIAPSAEPRQFGAAAPLPATIQPADTLHPTESSPQSGMESLSAERNRAAEADRGSNPTVIPTRRSSSPVATVQREVDGVAPLPPRKNEPQPDRNLEDMRARLLRQRMSQWWREANRDRRPDEEAAISRARVALSKKAAARIRSELAALPEAELLRIEAIWKKEELHYSKQKTQQNHVSSPGPGY